MRYLLNYICSIAEDEDTLGMLVGASLCISIFFGIYSWGTYGIHPFFFLLKTLG